MARTFDLTKVAVTFRGLPITDAFVNGDAVEVSIPENLFNKDVGSDGSVSRSAINNRTAEVTFNIKSTSPANRVFQESYDLDKADGSGSGELLIEDTLGTFRLYWPDAWVNKTPDLTLGADTPTVSWMLDCGQGVYSFTGTPV